LNLAFWKFVMLARKARTRFTYKLFLRRGLIETKTKDNYLLNLAKACHEPVRQTLRLRFPHQMTAGAYLVRDRQGCG